MLLWRLRLALPRLLPVVAALVVLVVALGLGSSGGGGACPADDAARGTAGRVPAGTRGIAVPTGRGAPPLRVGDRVEVLGGGAVVATGSVAALDPEAEAVTVAVPAARAPALAEALGTGDLVVALVP